MVKHYYYHLTQKPWAKRVTLKPRLHGCNRSDREPECKRICVSSNIERCLVALGSCLYRTRDIRIYRTENKVLGHQAWGVVDSKVTKEKWLTRPIKFVRVGIIKSDSSDLRTIFNMATGDSIYLKDQTKQLRRLIKLKKSYVSWESC